MPAHPPSTSSSTATNTPTPPILLGEDLAEQEPERRHRAETCLRAAQQEVLVEGLLWIRDS
jgi:hypothetical protein